MDVVSVDDSIPADPHLIIFTLFSPIITYLARLSPYQQ